MMASQCRRLLLEPKQKLLAHAELFSFDEKTDETTVAKWITPLMQAENKKGASEMFMRYAELVSEAGPAR